MELSAFVNTSAFLPFGSFTLGMLLLFSPVKLVLLIIWVYLCLFFVQKVQFSDLVPKSYKQAGYIVSLFAGPILFLVLQIVNVVRISLESRRGIFDVAKESFTSAFSRIRSLGFNGLGEKDNKIKLLNSAGRDLKDVYGHGKKQTGNILELTEQIITSALDDKASDILIDPRDNENYTIRYRVDGVLTVAYDMKTIVCKSVLNSIKALSGMDIAEKRRPQDGSFLAKMGKNTISFRVASAGARSGEKLSIRVLNQNVSKFTLETVGLSEKQRKVIREATKKPSGMILMCGPTGSGKTTTLYAMLNEIDLYTRNVITVEDPIEYVLENASQIEVNPKADITFANSLRSILRQDPDVICVGEIRDEETASIALRASQTGHLVIATIHCNSNAAAIVRLLDLGVSPLLLSSGMSLAISQRLLRQLCPKCKELAELNQSQKQEFHKKGINYRNIYQAEGCEDCRNTGYRGRHAIYDILCLSEELKNSIVNSESLVAQLRKDGDKKGKSNLHKQGLKMVVSGKTTLEELKRVVG